MLFLYIFHVCIFFTEITLVYSTIHDLGEQFHTSTDICHYIIPTTKKYPQFLTQGHGVPLLLVAITPSPFNSLSFAFIFLQFAFYLLLCFLSPYSTYEWNNQFLFFSSQIIRIFTSLQFYPCSIPSCVHITASSSQVLLCHWTLRLLP